MSPDGFARLPIHIIALITGRQPSFAASPWIFQAHPLFKNWLGKESGADALQLRSVARERFIAKIGTLDADQLDDIAYRVALCIGLKPF